MEIIYEDSNIICINKQAGIPSQPDLTKDISIYDKVKKRLKNEVYVLNRIDRPVSGIVLFAKNKKAARLYSDSLSESTAKKIYYAIVAEAPKEQELELTNYLIKKNNKAYVARNKGAGKKAILNYRLIGKGDRYNYLQISISTGRFHQIRVQLANIGSIIKGDVKYGARRSNKDRSICLHAYEMSIKDPFSNEELNLKADFPDKTLWKDLLRNIE